MISPVESVTLILRGSYGPRSVLGTAISVVDGTIIPLDLDEDCDADLVAASRVVSENQVIAMSVIGDGASGAVLALAGQLAAGEENGYA